MKATGTVYLVGAGPGDPELLTVKAMGLIQNADAVVYDRLVSSEIMKLVSTRALRIFAGKATGHHTLGQSQINQLLVELASRHQRIVRLKGGDPFVFGRGSEEALFLTGHGIPFELVPGVTAAQACAGYAGIPLTHRGMAHGVQMLAGHRRNNEALQIDAALLADDQQTLVVYMGLASLDQLVEQIVQAGRPVTTPAAVIENGTLVNQRVLCTTLGQLSITCKRAAIKAPALFVIGRVVELADRLDWFDPGSREARLRYA